MRRYTSIVLLISISILWSGCGRKGDPIRPPIPKPNPLRNVSARVTPEGIHLAWDAPQQYDTGKPLDVMRDIETITITRKQESSTDRQWDFARSRDGWQAIGQSLPLKWAHGVVRTASRNRSAGIVSPAGLALPAAEFRYISLRLWTQYADRAYVVFVTEADQSWDLDTERRFQPAVHTSFLSYQRAFGARKIKAIPLLPRHGASAQAQSYLLDMRENPAWNGTIRQIGMLVTQSSSAAGDVELGLDHVRVLNSDAPPPRLSDAPPWGFWQDAEGWQTASEQTLWGSAGGVLYLRNAAAPILAHSAPNQQLPWTRARVVHIRMQNRTRTQGYVLFRGADDPAFDLRALRSGADDWPLSVPLDLQPAEAFRVYTVLCPDFSDQPGTLAQIGLYVPGHREDEIVIDYMTLNRSKSAHETLAPLLLQKTIPPVADIADDVQRQARERRSGFEGAYAEWPAAQEVFDDQEVTLAEVTPAAPEPVRITEEGRFIFHDTGTGDGGESADVVPFQRGERYTYTITLTDGKGQVSAQSLSVNVPAIPPAPLLVNAAGGEGEVRLTWRRPFLDENGEKLRNFDGYHIYRSTRSGQYDGPPIYQVGPNVESFVDTGVVNGTTYYYVVRSVATITETQVVGGRSAEVAATPSDTQPPAAPDDVTAAEVGGAVKVFWSFSGSDDWQGFHVYRSVSEAGPFERLNADPVAQPMYTDMDVRPNQRYLYYVTAFDTARPPNESEPSTMAEITTRKR